MKKLICIEKGKNVNYPGMFDLLKGYAMIWVIIGHVDSLFESLLSRGGIMNNRFIDILVKIVGLEYAVIPIFFMISGYGFRATGVKKCIKKQAKSLLIPYAITAVITVGLMGFMRLLIYRSGLRYTVITTFFDALSYLFGTTYAISFWGNTVYNISTVWFLLALFLAWNLLNILVNISKGIWCHAAVFVCVVVGAVLGKYTTLPFCITQSLLGVGYMYFGVLTKKYNLFAIKGSPAFCLLLTGVLVIGACTPVSIYSGYLQFGLIGYLICGLYAYAFIYIFLKLSDLKFLFKDVILKIGRYSLWLICINSVVSTHAFWYWLVSRFGTDSYALFAIVLLTQIVITYSAYKVIYKTDKIITRKNREKRKKRRISGAE